MKGKKGAQDEQLWIRAAKGGRATSAPSHRLGPESRASEFAA